MTDTLPTRRMAENILLISSFEQKLLNLVASASEDTDEDVDPEAIEESKEEMRLSLLNSLRSSFRNELDEDNELPSAVYEEAVFSLLSDRMQRSMGYYNALSRAHKLVQDANNEVGDRAFSVETNKITTTLSHLDEITFLRTLCIGTGVLPADTDLIVKLYITRVFGPRKAE